jgi:hypothetical protein
VRYLFWLGPAIVRDEEIDTIKMVDPAQANDVSLHSSSRDAIQLESGPFSSQKQLFK